MSEPAIVVVPERGHAVLDPAEWRSLEPNQTLWSLVDAGILEARRLPDGRASLAGTRYVGVATLDDQTVLHVREKIPGALAALVSYATGRSFRVERAAAPATELAALAALLVHEFITAVRSYVTRGREFRYASKVERSPFVRGRIRTVDTMHLRARGLGHLVAFDRPTRDYRTPLNLAVFAAIREIERLARLVRIEDDDLSAARALAALFADCHTTEILVGRRSDWATRAAALAGAARDPRELDLLLLAGILLARQGFDLGQSQGGTVPRSWFLNLETLFESAVRRIVRELLVSMEVVHGRERYTFVFANERRLQAEPDLVIDDTARVVVGDVKYKEFGGAPDASDIYQLVAHAQAFGANTAFLVYPGDAYRAEHHGRALGVVDVFMFVVDVRELRRDLAAALTHLGLLP